MKKIAALILVMSFCLAFLCGCHTTTDENGLTVKGNGRFVFIECIDKDNEMYIAYDKETKVVFYYDDVGHNRGVHNTYYIYENGEIYGAVYEDGKIKPVPFANSSP